MKSGDLVRFKTLSWGEYGLITEIIEDGFPVMGQVYLLIESGIATIPLWKKDKYMEVISEAR